MSNSVEKSRISENIYKSLFKSVHVPSYVWKIVENDLILIEYNTLAEKITNGQIKNDLGRKASEIYKDQSEFYEGLSRCASSKCRVSKEIRTVCMTTGEEIYISVEYSHVPPDLVIVITRDVTERKNTEKKIIESEEKYRLLAENINEIIVVIDDKFQVEYINEEVYKKVLGTTKKDILGKKILDFVHPNDKTIGLNSLLKGIKDKEGIMEIRVRHRKGHYLWFETKGKAFLNNKGELKGILIARDITERKQAGEKLRESEERYRTLVETMTDGLAVIDENSCFTYLNISFCEMIGYSYDELLGTSIFNYLDKKNQIILEEQLDKRKKGDVQPYELVWTRKDGQNVYTIISPKPLIDVEGNYIGSFAVITNITERIIAVQKLKESEEKYRSLVETTYDWIWEVDEKAVYTYSSPKIKDILGYDVEEVIGKTPFDFMPSSEAERARDLFQKALQSNQPIISIENKNLHKNGSIIILESSGVPFFDDDGKLLGYRGIDRDVTEKMKTKQILQKTRQQLRDMFDNTPAAIYAKDLEGRFILVNNMWCERTNLGDQDPIGKTTPELFPHISLKKWFPYEEEVLKSGEILQFEEIGQTTGRVYLATKFLMRDTDGKVYALGNVSLDITERKKAVLKLKESEEKYHTLFDGANDAIFLMVKEIFFECNKKTLEMFGCENERDLIGVPPWVFSPTKQPDGRDSREKALEYINNALNGKPQRFYWKHSKKDGTTFDAEVSLNRIFIDDKYMIQAIVRDITELLMIVQKLEESEEKYRNLFESSPNMIVLINPNGKIIDVNPATLTQYGFERNDFIDKNFKELNTYLPGNLPILAKKFKELLTKGVLEPIELPFYTKDRNIIWVNIQGSLVKIGGETFIQTVIQDINERKEAELKIKESEEKLKTLNDTFLEFTDDPLKNIQLLVDAAGKLLMSDCAAYDKLIDVNGKKILKTIAIWQEPPNYDREDNPIGHICTDIINTNSDDIVIIKDLDKTKYAKTDPNVQKYNLKQYCGIAVKLNNEPVASFCVIYTKNRKLSEVDKNIIRILAKSASIEEQRLYSYQKIKESEHKFKLIFDSIPDLFFLIDKDTTILDFKGREDILYVPAEKLINHKLSEIIPRDIADLNYIATKKTLLTKQPQILEYELPIHDANRHFEARHLYFSENQVAVFIREITARKKTEQNLRESEEKYRRLFENSPEAIMLTNIDGMVLDFNSAAEKIFGFGKNEVMGRYFYQFGIFNSDQIAIIKNRIMDLSLVTQKKFEEFKIKRKDGSILWVLFQSSIVKLGNEPYIFSIAQDITEIKKAEKLIEKELIKLKELDEIKNELITRASHEFKTPLTLILGSAELFLKLYKDVYTDEMKQLIEIIYKGGKRLENLVKNTIDISLMESKSISFRSEREDIGKLINECVDDLIYLADKRELSVELNVQENLFIPIDKNKITQVIKNIVSNAIKNTPPKGNISISLNRINEHLQISIKDTGVGFTETEKQRLFQKFGKIERYGKDFNVDIEGPGLGLYLSKQIIEMHGGKIWVESEGINKGATFIIELPINL